MANQSKTYPKISQEDKGIAIFIGIGLLALAGIFAFNAPIHTTVEKSSDGSGRTVDQESDSTTIVVTLSTIGAAVLVFGLNGLQITRLTSSLFESRSDPIDSELKPNANSVPTPGGQLHVPNFISGYLDASSWAGLKVIYAALLSAKTEKPLRLEEVCQRDAQMTFHYAYGYLVATASIGLFQLDGTNPNTGTIKAVMDAVGPALEKAIKNRLKMPPEWESHKRAEIARIEELFQVTVSPFQSEKTT